MTKYVHSSGQSIFSCRIDEFQGFVKVGVFIHIDLQGKIISAGSLTCIWSTHSHDGAEDFLSHRDRLGVLGLDDGRLDKISSRTVGVSTEQNFRALLLSFGNIASDLLECRLAATKGESAAIEIVMKDKAYITGPMKFSHFSEGPTLIFAVSSKSIFLNWGHTDEAMYSLESAEHF
jgi:hypothetical protein